MTPAGLPPLPALRRLDDLADLRPVVVIDSREQAPLPVKRLRTVRGTLSTGDYPPAGLEHLAAIERKPLDDLAACCMGENRERFFRELNRLQGIPFRRLLVVGSVEEIEAHRYRSRITPAAVLATLAVVEARWLCPVVHVFTPEEGASLVERWCWWACREAVVTVNGLCRACPADASQVEPNGAQ